MFPLWFALLGDFFCLLRHGSFHFVPCFPLFLGCFGLYLIARVSSFGTQPIDGQISCHRFRPSSTIQLGNRVGSKLRDVQEGLGFGQVFLT
jgi:hypothetical protein